MRQRRFRVGALVLVVTVVLGGWSASSLASSAQRDRTSAKPVVIGISLSLSGDFSDEGKAAMRGYKLWQAHQNAQGGLMGRKIQLKIVDDTSSPDQAVTNYTNLITKDKVAFVLGPFVTLLTATYAMVGHHYGQHCRVAAADVSGHIHEAGN